MKSGIKKYFLQLSLSKINAVLIVPVMLLFYTCETSIDPSEYSGNEFPGQISNSFETAVIKSDGSLWFVSHDFLDSQSVINPEAEKFEKLKHLISIESVEGLYFASDYSGNIWHWGFWMPSSIMYDPVMEPFNICNLPGVRFIDYSSHIINMLCCDGTVWQCEFNYSNPATHLIPKQVDGLQNIIKISNGFALKEDGSIYELIHNEPEYGGFIGNLKNIIDIANTSGRRTFIVKNDGTVWGWGRNDYGEIKTGEAQYLVQPVKVLGLEDVISISSNYDYYLAMKKDGTVWYWGYNGRNENNEPTATTVSIKIEGLDDVVLFEASLDSFFKTKDGKYWSYNVFTKKLVEIHFD